MHPQSLRERNRLAVRLIGSKVATFGIMELFHDERFGQLLLIDQLRQVRLWTVGQSPLESGVIASHVGEHDRSLPTTLLKCGQH